MTYWIFIDQYLKKIIYFFKPSTYYFCKAFAIATRESFDPVFLMLIIIFSFDISINITTFLFNCWICFDRRTSNLEKNPIIVHWEPFLKSQIETHKVCLFVSYNWYKMYLLPFKIGILNLTFLLRIRNPIIHFWKFQ